MNVLEGIPGLFEKLKGMPLYKYGGEQWLRIQ